MGAEIQRLRLLIMFYLYRLADLTKTTIYALRIMAATAGAIRADESGCLLRG